MNSRLLISAIVGATTPMVAQALDIGVMGQASRVIRFADNSQCSEVRYVDGLARFRFTVESEAILGITAGARIEYGSANRDADGLGVEQEDGGVGFDAHHSLLHFSGDFGKVTLGNAQASAKASCRPVATAHGWVPSTHRTPPANPES